MAMGKFGGGNGTTSAPYLVEDEEDLRMVGKYLSRHFKQVKDIVVTGDLWEGIGNAVSPFTGSYDGMGYSITGLRFCMTTEVLTMYFNSETLLPMTYYTGSQKVRHTGLFNNVESPGVLKNINTEVYVSYCYEPTEILSIYAGVGISVSGIVARYNNSAPLENCHSKMIADVELYRRSSGYYYISNFIICGLASLASASINCSVDIVINNKAVVTDNYEMRLIVSPHTAVYGSLTNYAKKYEALNFKCSVKLYNQLGKDNFTNIGSNKYKSSVYWTPTQAISSHTDCEYKDIIFNADIIDGVQVPVYWSTYGMVYGDATRLSIVNSSFNVLSTGGRIAPVSGTAVDCRVIKTTICVQQLYDYSTGTISGVSVGNATRCLVKDCIIEGLHKALHVAGVSSSTTTDCSVVNTRVKSKSRAAGILCGDGQVLRCVFSGGSVEGVDAYLGGLLTTVAISEYYSVKDSFFLGEYVKGVGALTVQAGLISALASTGNKNNYSLDTARLILE